MTYIVGRYTATFNSSSIGRTQDGFELIETPHFAGINTDDYGDVEADVILRGMTVEVQLQYVEYDLIKPALYGVEAQGIVAANAGVLGSAQAHALVLTSVANSTASGTYTFTKAIVLTDFTTMLKNNLRTGPCRFRILPATTASSACYTVA